MKVVISVQGHIVAAGNTCIAHNGRSASRFGLDQGAFGLKGPGVVGTKLMSHFMGHKIQIKSIPLRNQGGRIATSFSGVYADRSNEAGIPPILIILEQMAYIVVYRAYNRCKGVLYFGI